MKIDNIGNKKYNCFILKPKVRIKDIVTNMLIPNTPNKK